MYKITNKTNQTFRLIEDGYLYPYSFIMVIQKNEQIVSMVKKGLISIKEL